MKLFGSIKSKIAKKENGEKVPHLEITEVVLVHLNIVNNDYQHDSRVRVLYTFFAKKLFGQFLDIFTKKLYFQKHLIQNFNILTSALLMKILNL